MFTTGKFKITEKNSEKKNDLEFINKLPYDLFNHMASFLEEPSRVYKLQYFECFNKMKPCDLRFLYYRPALMHVRKKYWSDVRIAIYPKDIKSHEWQYFKKLEFIDSNNIGDWIIDLYNYLVGRLDRIPELASISIYDLDSTEIKKYKKQLEMFEITIRNYTDHGDFNIKDMPNIHIE